MANDFKKKGAQSSPETPLDELLRDATDEQEKKLLSKAWHALGGLSGREHDPPGPSEELETIFGKSPKYSSVTKETGEETMTSNAAKLYRKIMSDKAIQTELAGIEGKAEGLEAIVKLGESHSLPVTPEEVRDFLSREPGEELTDAELEMVVGGKGNPNEEIKGDKWSWIGLPDDDLDGGDGNDTMYGGDGDDKMSGGTGDDSMDGGWGAHDDDGGSDTMSGGDGNDTMWGGHGDDSMNGDAGNDKIHGGTGDDTMSGGAGNDAIYGGTGDDTMSGGAGNDYMKGEEGDDTMDGGAGNDTMNGGAGNDSMSGGAGNDSMEGGAGSDTLSGGDGNDTLDGGIGAGDDRLIGGDGNDVFVFGKEDGNDVITDFNPAEDKINFWNAQSPSEIEVSAHGGKTYISYGNTSITLEGVEMTRDEVWACRK